jgi:hypothetical protein
MWAQGETSEKYFIFCCLVSKKMARNEVITFQELVPNIEGFERIERGGL